MHEVAWTILNTQLFAHKMTHIITLANIQFTGSWEKVFEHRNAPKWRLFYFTLLLIQPNTISYLSFEQRPAELATNSYSRLPLKDWTNVPVAPG